MLCLSSGGEYRAFKPQNHHRHKHTWWDDFFQLLGNSSALCRRFALTFHRNGRRAQERGGGWQWWKPDNEKSLETRAFASKRHRERISGDLVGIRVRISPKNLPISEIKSVSLNYPHFIKFLRLFGPPFPLLCGIPYCNAWLRSALARLFGSWD